MSEGGKSKFTDEFLALLADTAGRQIFVDAVASAFHHDIFRRDFDSYNVDRIAFFAAAITSSQYVIRHMKNAKRMSDALALLDFAVKNKSLEGAILEFGTFSGRTINHIAKLLPTHKVYGFDSFEGLPEEWRDGFKKGSFARAKLPEVRDNVELVVGWFDRTLPIFLDKHPDQKVALLHVDCDIYSSTQTILQQLKNRIVPGTIIVFDEYYNYPGWEMHEFRAFQDFVEVNHIHYDYIGLVPGHQQVAVQIIR